MKVISGGQTGVDRGALDAAHFLGMETGGACPKGRRAEDGEIPAKYALEEHSSSAYPPRTATNVQNSDVTLILVYGKKVSRGTKLTAEIAQRQKRTWRAFDISRPGITKKILEWLVSTRPLVLNVAGPRESSFPGIQQKTEQVLRQVFTEYLEKNPDSSERT